MQEGLKRILQDFSGIERMTVEYRTWASGNAEGSGSHATSGVNAGVCSENGTTVTVTFESISIEVGTLDRRRRH